MNKNKDAKIQVLLSSDDYSRLEGVIIRESAKNGKLMTVSAYVRNLILSHIIVNDGDQVSFASETVKKLIYENELLKTKEKENK